MNIITGFGLNVWDDGIDTSVWKMAVYPDYNGHTDTATFLTLEATPARLSRYFEISQDNDWWVYDQDPDFNYILWGDRV